MVVHIDVIRVLRLNTIGSVANRMRTTKAQQELLHLCSSLLLARRSRQPAEQQATAPGAAVAAVVLCRRR